jgi:RNA polymerase sigma factor (TIGR02999 family)
MRYAGHFMHADVTRILRAIEAGEPQAAGDLLPLVYAELRRLAAREISHERPGMTLQATALVHEAYLRLVSDDVARPGWNSTGHFFAAAAEAMRRILVERARARGAEKRGGNRKRVAIDPNVIAEDPDRDEILDLDAALARLAEEDPRKAKLVELRFFAGLSLEEAAAVLAISPATADRDWAYARAWLYAELSEPCDGENSEKA